MLHDTCYILNATSYMLYATWNASDSWSSITRVFSLHNMRPITLHEFLKHMLAKASVGWSITYTTWFSLHYMAFLNAYTGMKRLCWHISNFHYMSSFTLHELFASVYWNETPVMVKSICWLVHSLHYMSFLYTTRVFRMYIPEWNDLLAYLWLTLHEIHYTTWTFCMCILEWNACDGQKHLVAGL